MPDNNLYPGPIPHTQSGSADVSEPQTLYRPMRTLRYPHSATIGDSMLYNETAVIDFVCETIADLADAADDLAFDEALTLEVARYDEDPTGGQPSRY